MVQRVFELKSNQLCAQSSGCRLVCVIDTSGSMNSTLDVENVDSGVRESSGISILELIKHAIRTVIAMMSPKDSLALVSFNDEADILLPMTRQDVTGKTASLAAVSSLEPDGSTNLWAGIVQAISICKDSPTATTVFILTDGLPTYNPPRGYGTSLLNLFEKAQVHPVIHTFGFGLSLQLDTLTEICDTSLGNFNYIPDGSFVGTIFINAAANALATTCYDVAIYMDDQQVRVGNLKGDGPHYVVVETMNITTASSGINVLEISADSQLYQEQLARTQVVKFLQSTVNSVDGATDRLVDLKDALSRLKSSPYLRGLQDDLAGQIQLAISPAYFLKWGKLYLAALMRAHDKQVCTNFKDKSLQLYTSPIFASLQDVGDDAFVSLAPPKRQTRGGRNATPAPPMAMASFLNRGGG